ncbi:hypothetical protein Pmani_018461 [Petrolisthes manimaculis]|uniref:Uncharacterized protein n=1 Tax=Petrolisthes manimaculis TaxID=1843537 RepID=A0AAE1U4U4_9EUCA|nr:hypothetical protein Pmani_018461 [Petrolisthes manimaculis]
MQCANIFFILSIGFASAALAVGNPFTTSMKIISPGIKSFEVLTSEGIISNKFELGDWRGASVMCSHIDLPNLLHQRLVISDWNTNEELFSVDSGTLLANEAYVIEEDFTIDLTDTNELLWNEQRPQVECIIEQYPASHYVQFPNLPPSQT